MKRREDMPMVRRRAKEEIVVSEAVSINTSKSFKNLNENELVLVEAGGVISTFRLIVEIYGIYEFAKIAMYRIGYYIGKNFG